MSPDMFNLSALTELWQAELTTGEAGAGLCEEGRGMWPRRAWRRGTQHGHLIKCLWASSVGWRMQKKGTNISDITGLKHIKPMRSQ